MSTFRKQFRHRSVALISLAVSLAGLAYNTWRNELTAANRNVRTAGAELLLTLAGLEQTVFRWRWWLRWTDSRCTGADSGHVLLQCDGDASLSRVSRYSRSNRSTRASTDGMS